MKNSGIEWIGCVPNSWELNKIGCLFNCRNEKVSDKDYQPLSVSKIGVVPQMENVAKSDASDDRKLVLKNDFAINSRSDRKQSCGVSPLDGSVSLINTILYVKNNSLIFGPYLNFLLKNYGFAEEFYRWGHGIVADLWTTRWQEMKNIIVPLPDVQMQKCIYKFLSTKLEQIDMLVENENKQIVKLLEYEQLIIDETIEKYSSEKIKLKYKCSYSCSNLAAKDLNLNNGKTKVYGASGFSGYIDIEGQDIDYLGIIKDGAGVGRINFYPKGTLLVGTMGMIYPNRDVDITFLKYSISAMHLQESIDCTTIPHIYFSDYGNRFIPNIDIIKQLKISDYLQSRTTNINKLIEIKKKKIEKLVDYKKSLIYEYVTGKKEALLNA